MKIGNVDLENNVFLAPLAGVTDLPFRVLCKEFGCGLVFSEMISGKGILYDNQNTKQLLEIDDRERPIGIQLFGREPEVLSEACKRIEHLPFDIFDINMGCPVPKVVRNGEGSALLKEPVLIGKIVSAIVNSVKKPLTIKIRIGFDENSINAVEVAKIAEASGVSAITVHGRTREQYYSGKANWEVIKMVKDSVKIPVIGNGDIKDQFDAERIFRETNCDGIMIGRGAQGNPFIFKSILHYLKFGELVEEPSIKEKIKLAKRHAKMLVEYKGEFIGIREMRRHLSDYTKGMKHSAKLRAEINKIEDLDSMTELLDRIV